MAEPLWMVLLAWCWSQSIQPSIIGSIKTPAPRALEQALSVNLQMCAITEQGNTLCVCATGGQVALMQPGICSPDILLPPATSAWQFC